MFDPEIYKEFALTELGALYEAEFPEIPFDLRALLVAMLAEYVLYFKDASKKPYLFCYRAAFEKAYYTGLLDTEQGFDFHIQRSEQVTAMLHAKIQEKILLPQNKTDSFFINQQTQVQ